MGINFGSGKLNRNLRVTLYNDVITSDAIFSFFQRFPLVFCFLLGLTIYHQVRPVKPQSPDLQALLGDLRQSLELEARGAANDFGETLGKIIINGDFNNLNRFGQQLLRRAANFGNTLLGKCKLTLCKNMADL